MTQSLVESLVDTCFGLQKELTSTPEDQQVVTSWGFEDCLVYLQQTARLEQDLTGIYQKSLNGELSMEEFGNILWKLKPWIEKLEEARTTLDDMHRGRSIDLGWIGLLQKVIEDRFAVIERSMLKWKESVCSPERGSERQQSQGFNTFRPLERHLRVGPVPLFSTCTTWWEKGTFFCRSGSHGNGMPLFDQLNEHKGLYWNLLDERGTLNRE